MNATNNMRTTLYNSHLAMGARMVPFAGWEMPVLYRGIVAEHLWTRSNASVFDICHMGEFEFRGPTAESDLERLITQRVSSMKIGSCSYGYLLAEDGGVLDDLVCLKLAEDRFWLVVNAGTLSGDREWIQGRISSRTNFTDLSPATAKLDIQGPLAHQEMKAAFGQPVPALGYFRFQETNIQGVNCLLSRTGYTGEWGYELYLPINEATRFWKMLCKGGGIMPAGLGARDTLRVEMGFPLYGHELRREWRPAGASGGRFIDMNKEFTGREALRREMESGAYRLLTGLVLEGRMAARAGDSVIAGGVVAGEVTSGLFSPSLNVAVALAYVDKTLSAPGTALEIRSRDKSLRARVESLPMYKKGTARSVAAEG